MNDTPRGERLHVSIFGAMNAGKSTLFNGILGNDLSIISPVQGTTTDPVLKSMELLPFGPIVLIDTAGNNDKTELGEERIKKTNKMIDRTDYAIYVIDYTNFRMRDFQQYRCMFRENKIPYTVVINRMESETSNELKGEKIFIQKDNLDFEELKLYLSNELWKISREDKSLLAQILDPGDHVLLIIPIDGEAPKGRIILPQVQIIRECLDNMIVPTIVNEKNLGETLEKYKDVKLAITDSKIFKQADEIIKDRCKLTSFSILMADKKGDLEQFLEGTKAIKDLKDGDNILIAEVCNHTSNHEDIGQVVIPNALKKFTGKDLNFTFNMGGDYDIDLNKYALVIHCGGCMVNSKEVMSRIKKSKDKGIPITNYGMVLALVGGILEKSIECLKE